AQVFVAVQGASNYTYAEATWSQDLESWISCHTHAFSFFGRWNFTEEGSQIKESLIEDTVMEEMELLLEEIKASPADFIVVSNEVGMGLVPPYPLGRIFRDLMGRAHQLLAEAADEAYLLVAGLPQKLK
ncbi:adenosylcobinamide kinase / adenosylcobinamide-phosphate guanylyltransferase, partial [Candidatus Hakubella thermalkaliphila]